MTSWHSRWLPGMLLFQECVEGRQLLVLLLCTQARARARHLARSSAAETQWRGWRRRDPSSPLRQKVGQGAASCSSRSAAQISYTRLRARCATASSTVPAAELRPRPLPRRPGSAPVPWLCPLAPEQRAHVSGCPGHSPGAAGQAQVSTASPSGPLESRAAAGCTPPPPGERPRHGLLITSTAAPYWPAALSCSPGRPPRPASSDPRRPTAQRFRWRDRGSATHRLRLGRLWLWWDNRRRHGGARSQAPAVPTAPGGAGS